MNCKLCFREWDTHLILPEVLLPCAHTFCNKCLNEISDSLSCPDCGSLICDRKLNSAVFELVDHKSSTLLNELCSHLNRVESSKSMLQLRYEMKLQNIGKKIENFEREIENQARSQTEIILSNQAKLRTFLETEKNKINRNLKAFMNEDELVPAKIELIKANIKSSTNLKTHQMQCFINDLKNVLEQRNAKLVEIENISLNFEFERNDLIIINSDKIVGQLVFRSNSDSNNSVNQAILGINTLSSEIIVLTEILKN